MQAKGEIIVKKTIDRSELTNHKMVAGNESKYSKVILDGVLKEWVGIGWIDLGEPDDHDRATYPVVEAS